MMRLRRLDLWILGLLVVFGMAFVVGATWMGSKERARYRLEPLPAGDSAEIALAEALAILRPRYGSGVTWLRADRDGRDAVERRLVTLDPEESDKDTWLELVVVRLLQDRPAAAADAARAALVHHDSNCDLLLALGIALERTGDSAGALVSLDRAHEAAPEDIDVLFRRGRLHYSLRQFEKAREDAERGVLLAPRFPELQRLMAEACLATHDLGRAKRAFLDVLQLLPEDEQARRQASFLDGSK